ncbi:unnamed protein product [Rotaria sp. Silwood1]|nr:unnamed protein product [Rotaria sp. Silwood1]CAF1662461.1 unnamed protein product [Rotaria sp. Silwood1]
MQTRSTLDTSSNKLFTNIERLGTHDLLSYGQFSYDTILTSIQSNNTLPLSINVHLYIYLIYFILLEHTTKEYNELYLRLIELNYKLITKTHAYASCLFLLENDNLTQKIISISLEKLLIVDNILIELVEELYTRTKQSSTLPYEALLLLRPLSLLLAHISFFFRALINARYSAKVNEWTLLLMTNIAQTKSLCMAIWGLTCLMFLLMLSRFIVRFEESDYRLFLIADRK